jgi:hypothetical protein
MVKHLRAVYALIKESHAYKIYALCVVLALGKQVFSYTELIDSREYLCAAKSVFMSQVPDSCLDTLQGHQLPHTRRTIGYPFLIYLTGAVPLLLIVLQSLISLLLPLLAKRTLSVFTYAPRPHALLQWLMLLSPLQFFYTGFLMPEIWTEFLLLLLLYLYLKDKLLGMMLCLSALVLLKPVFILLLFIATAFAFFGIRRRWILLFSWIPVLIAGFLHYQKWDLWHYSSVAVENKWSYNQRVALESAMAPTKVDSFYLAQDKVLLNLNYKHKSQYMDSLANINITSHFKGYFSSHIKGCVKMLFDPGRYDFVAFMALPEGKGFMQANGLNSIADAFKRQSPIVWLYLVLFGLVGLIKWTCFILGVRNHPKIGLTLLAIMVIFIGVTGPVGSARYLLPFLPWIAIMASLSRDTHENTAAE